MNDEENKMLIKRVADLEYMVMVLSAHLSNIPGITPKLLDTLSVNGGIFLHTREEMGFPIDINRKL